MKTAEIKPACQCRDSTRNKFIARQQTPRERQPERRRHRQQPPAWRLSKACAISSSKLKATPVPGRKNRDLQAMSEGTPSTRSDRRHQACRRNTDRDSSASHSRPGHQDYAFKTATPWGAVEELLSSISPQYRRTSTSLFLSPGLIHLRRQRARANIEDDPGRSKAEAWKIHSRESCRADVGVRVMGGSSFVI